MPQAQSPFATILSTTILLTVLSSKTPYKRPHLMFGSVTFQNVFHSVAPGAHTYFSFNLICLDPVYSIHGS